MSLIDRVVVFAGPSMVGIDLTKHADLTFCPPIRRGEVDALVECTRVPGILLIVDGIFHHYPSVGHSEIRRAVDCGWQVWGASSMGAIRAAEMVNFGMRGFGQVFQRFVDDPDFTDDEVALLYLGEPPYIPVTEPLIHVRRYLQHLEGEGRITAAQAWDVLMALKQMWFGYRSMDALHGLMQRHTSLDGAAVQEDLRGFHRFRIKNQDLEALLEARPWQKGVT